MKDKSGKEITKEEFMARWKQGMKEISPLQQTKISLIGSWLVIAGVIAGIVTSLIIGAWWLLAILLGSLLVTGVSLLGLWQKYSALKKIEEQIKQFGGINNEIKQSTSTSYNTFDSDRASDGLPSIN